MTNEDNILIEAKIQARMITINFMHEQIKNLEKELAEKKERLESYIGEIDWLKTQLKDN
jgi:hypothetical protein